jgi:hypothetical protein
MKTFQCPNCNQFINDSMTECKFCSTPLDPQVVSQAVENQDKVNDAYNAASNLRILAGVLASSFFLSFIPLINLVVAWIFRIIFIGLPFMLIYWQIRYGRIKTSDQDFKQAKKYWWTALGIWLIFLAVTIFFVMLYSSLLLLS